VRNLPTRSSRGAGPASEKDLASTSRVTIIGPDVNFFEFAAVQANFNGPAQQDANRWNAYLDRTPGVAYHMLFRARGNGFGVPLVSGVMRLGYIARRSGDRPPRNLYPFESRRVFSIPASVGS
jgi:hypothetical protein